MTDNVLKFPRRYLWHDCDLANHLRSLLSEGHSAQNTEELARLTGANPTVIDLLFEQAVQETGYGGGAT